METTEIRIRCICPAGPDSHPDGDVVGLPSVLDFARLAILTKTLRWAKTLNERISPPEALAILADAYLRHCLVSWTLQDERGKPIPLSEETIERYLIGAAPDAALEIADRADDLYQEAVLSPLVPKEPTLSVISQTETSISPTKANGAAPIRKRSSRSSSSSTRTTAIAATG